MITAYRSVIAATSWVLKTGFRLQSRNKKLRNTFLAFLLHSEPLSHHRHHLCVIRSLMAEIEIKTAPADFRFPTFNQTRHCFTRYIEFHRCVAAKGEGASECEIFAKYYRSLCPGEWEFPQFLIGNERLACNFTCLDTTSPSVPIRCEVVTVNIEKWNEQRENGTFPGPL